MVAFPTCLPGMTTSIPHDESHITALDIHTDGHIYGGTSGRQAHVFAAAFHGLTGVVFDAGVVAGGTNTVAVCCGASRVVAFANGPQGGRAVALPYLDLAQDWIQEWGFEAPPLHDLGACVPEEEVVHAVRAASGKVLVGTTTHHLFTIGVDSGATTVVAEVPGRGHLAVGAERIYGQDQGNNLWSFDIAAGKLHRSAVVLPQGEWTGSRRWARNPASGVLFTADATGRLYAFDEKRFRELGKTHLAPVGPMAVTPDGRLFGFCGEEMANLFCWDASGGDVMNLGVAASVLEKRRYGYQFGDALTGRDGELVFGEDDNDGHLWLYFPRLRPQEKERVWS
jgi:outer membrane protein assembly factor BamB